MELKPIVFEPLFMERVWGSRRLETLYRRRLPAGARIGESWEVVDRPEAQSVVHGGALRGRTLHELWTGHREDIFGSAMPDAPRFPLLFKLLDAFETLSVQVHPPAAVAGKLEGEPKTEMWYVLDAEPGSSLYAGLRRGVSREEFEASLRSGDVAARLHQVSVAAGDAIFIPSGRIHAIGAGNVIFEVQQNSDTTYRVFDWNRVGLDGKPRELHIAESMESILFDDFEPELAAGQDAVIADSEFFRVERIEIESGASRENQGFSICMVIGGRLECAGERFEQGAVFLVPERLEAGEVKAMDGGASLLRTTIPVRESGG